MHAAALNVLRSTVRRPIPRSTCRIIAGSRYSLPKARSRNLQTTPARWRSVPSPEDNGNENTKNGVQVEDVEVEKELINRKARSLRARFRANRERGLQPQEGIPPVEYPRGYMFRCVLCAEEARRFGNLAAIERGSSDGKKEKWLILRGARQALKEKLSIREQKDSATPELTKCVKETEDTQLKTHTAGEDSPETIEDLFLLYDGEPGAWKVRDVETLKGKPDASVMKDKMEDEDILQSLLEDIAGVSFTIHEDVYNEIHYTLRGGLTLTPPNTPHDQPTSRPITLLQTPQDGAMDFLDNIVETVAQDTNADLIRLNAQDLAETLSVYIGENVAWQAPEISTLGYETARAAGKIEDYGNGMDPTPFEEDVEGAEEEEDAPGAGKASMGTSFPKFDLTNILKSIKTKGHASSRKSSSNSNGGLPGMQIFDLSRTLSSKQLSPPSLIDHWENLKINAALEKLIMGADEKRASAKATDDAHNSKPRNLIVQIQDYKEISATRSGAEILAKIRAIVDKKWHEGRNIICVGTTANDEIVDSLALPEIQQLQSDAEGETRTIYVPTERSSTQMSLFFKREKAQIQSINIRQIEEMIIRMADGVQKDGFEVSIALDLADVEHQEFMKEIAKPPGQLDSPLGLTPEVQKNDATNFDGGGDVSRDAPKEEYLALLEEAVWTHARVRRLVTVMLGQSYPLTKFGGREFNNAMKIMTCSDEAKVDYGKVVIKKLGEADQISAEYRNGVRGSGRIQNALRLRELTKTCTAHEKKLIKGIVLSSDIKTTFNDIRAPPETIEALKTLTGLSLSRPEAFSYGVLATDKIPGLLLYGPPGTGKTLLAKAVAKESGATVLEVSGADVNDKYVGEGEKNVKAVFSLAKKLSPCIVFIDEADAIFASRGGGKQRSSHRELINQFLREWDGMKDMSTFIMIATNRPFDLDDAVLRRLPRKLLVDLPLEKDREAILSIHLKDEILDPSVSMSQLAKDTPFYSGSDLKNVAVAAALACIRDENAIAAKHTGEEPYLYPAKRTLRKEHFVKALEEISASVSEDMGTLSQIRKFDESYGDRKGRRKKTASLGFGGTTIVEKDSEAARVRKLIV